MNDVVKNIILNWYEKAQTEDNIFNRFISLWIAFNAYYAANDSRASEHEQLRFIRDIHKTLFLSVTHEHPDEFSAFKEYIETKKQNRGFIQDLRYDVKEEKHKKQYRNLDSLCEYLDCVYQIRCNLFHGGKDIADAQDEKLVELASNTLIVFFGKFLKEEGIIHLHKN